MMVLIFLLASLAVSSSVLAAPNYAVPDAQPTNAVAIDSAPVGVSYVLIASIAILEGSP